MPLNIRVVEKVRVKETPDTKIVKTYTLQSVIQTHAFHCVVTSKKHQSDKEIDQYSYKVHQSDQKFVPLYQQPPPQSPTASEIFEAVNDNSLILNELLDMTP